MLIGTSMFWGKISLGGNPYPKVSTTPSLKDINMTGAWFWDVWDGILMINKQCTKRTFKRWRGHIATKTPQIAIRNEADMIWTIKRKHSSCLCRESGLHCFFDVLGVILIQNPTYLCTSDFLSRIFFFPCLFNKGSGTAYIDFLQHLRWQSLQGSCGNCFDQFLQWKVPWHFSQYLLLILGNEHLWWLHSQN